MHASKGIELFKERAVAALFKEYKQLNDMAVVGKVKYEDLSDEDKNEHFGLSTSLRRNVMER